MRMTMVPNTRQDSYERTRRRFDKASAAAKYATRFGQSRRHVNEERCVHAALADIPAGSLVLDLPCGTGRLTNGLVSRGFRVTGADNSAHMIAVARSIWQQLRRPASPYESPVTFDID